jgi:flagellar biogenesis protein FliO
MAQGKAGVSWLAAFFSRVFSAAAGGRNARRLRLCETLSLGEKRFIAVVEYDRQKFMVAGTPQQISLLQRLGGDCIEPDRAPRREPLRRQEEP